MINFFKKKLNKDKQEKIKIAKLFNDRYTYIYKYIDGLDRLPGTSYGGLDPIGGNAWMCPECNKIHLSVECSVFDGLHYYRCCSTPFGNRLNCGIKINCKS